MSNAKSSILFSPNINLGVRENVCPELNKVTKALSDTCPGLPTMVGIDRSDCFHHLLIKLSKVEGMERKDIVYAG